MKILILSVFILLGMFVSGCVSYSYTKYDSNGNKKYTISRNGWFRSEDTGLQILTEER